MFLEQKLILHLSIIKNYILKTIASWFLECGFSDTGCVPTLCDQQLGPVLPTAWSVYTREMA